MKIWHISDTHGLHGQLSIPDVDMLIFSGDAGTYKNCYRNEQGVLDFIEWIESIDTIKHKIWIAGNHDTSIEAGLVKPKELCKSSIYLQHEFIEVEGIKIFGSPYTPWFYDWAFNVTEDKLKDCWKDIPNQLDILITHGPSYGNLDVVSFDGYLAGDKELLSKIDESSIHYHLFGHIHENIGKKMMTNDVTIAINSAIVNDEYKLVSNGQMFQI